MDSRRFIGVDTHGAVKIGELETNTEAVKVVRPSFNKAHAAVLEKWMN